MATFDSLPLELKERILAETGDYKTLAKVSKEWRHHVRTSRKIMQRELDKYFFFFAIWLNRKKSDPEQGDPIMFVFPIVTEEQFFLLRKHGETKFSQVGAVEKNADIPKLLFREDWVVFFRNTRPARRNLTLGSTETLIERLKEGGLRRRAIFAYATALRADIRDQLSNLIIVGKHLKMVSDLPKLLESKLRFSDKEEMLKVLKGEHKIFPLEKGLLVIKQRNYDKLEQFSDWRNFSNSLFLPRWSSRQSL